MKTLAHNDRLEIRLDASEKARIETAASIRGQKASVFVREVMIREASAVVAQHTTVSLTAEESRRFMDALSAPFKPNPKLARAIARTGR